MLLPLALLVSLPQGGPPPSFPPQPSGFTQRVDAQADGDFTEWSADGERLYWTRGSDHCSKNPASSTR